MYIIRPSSVNRCRTIHGDWYHHYLVKSVSERGEIRRSKNYKITKKSKTTLLNTDKSQHRLCKRPCLENNALLRNPIDIFVCLCSSGDKSNSWKAHLLYGWCVSYSYGERDCLSAGGYERKTKRSTLTITTLRKQWIYAIFVPTSTKWSSNKPPVLLQDEHYAKWKENDLNQFKLNVFFPSVLKKFSSNCGWYIKSIKIMQNGSGSKIRWSVIYCLKWLEIINFFFRTLYTN